MLSDKLAVRDLLAICKEKSIESVIFSPGSRNAPLVISFNQDPSFQCISLPDERSAAFFAIGLAQQTKKPVIISCTSGSAVLNYAPAIAEAYYQKIPLIVVTADRPMEWTDQGDGQTMRQVGVYHNYIKKSYTLIQESQNEDDRWYNRRLITEAIHTAQYEIPGPVHINIPFREPLYKTSNTQLKEQKVVTFSKYESKVSQQSLEKMSEEWSKFEKKLIICGQMEKGKRLKVLLEKLLQDPSVSLISESTSNIYSEKINPCIDRVITTFSEKEEMDYTPDLLVSIGGAVVSKKIKALLRKHRPSAHWHIGQEHQLTDVYQSLTRQISVDPIQFLTQWKPPITFPDSSYQKIWTERTHFTGKRHNEFIDRCEWSDLKAFRHILKQIPANTTLHMANSSPVRYVQLFDNREDIIYRSNRGVSGIDGCNSTAAGASFNDDSNHILITGDLGFVYDSNALWNKHLKNNLKIIVINNSGGGIFRIIPGPSESGYLDEFFECEHPVEIGRLCKAFNCSHRRAENENELEDQLQQFLSECDSSRPSVLEITTPRKRNDIVLKEYFDYIKK